MFVFFKAEDGIRDSSVTGVQTCALPIRSDSTSRAETEVDALAKRQVIVRAARDVESLRLGKLRRVAIRRAKHYRDYRPRLYASPAHFSVVLREAHQHLHRAVIAQHLLDSPRH